MNVLPGGGGTGGGTDIRVVGASPAFRVNSDNTITDLVLITAYSGSYGVTFSFFVLKTTYDADGAPNLAGLTGTAVDSVCGYKNVQAFRSEQDEDNSRLIYNYGIIGVGTDDGSFYGEVSQRMDLLDTPQTFALIDAEWARQVALGAGNLPVVA